MRIARAEGKRGADLAARIAELKANPTDAMMQAARVVAEKQTFTNPLGKFGQGLQAMASDVPALRVVMPFIRTPVNIVKYAATATTAPLTRHIGDKFEILFAELDDVDLSRDMQNLLHSIRLDVAGGNPR